MYNESVSDSYKRSLRNVTDVVTPMLADMVDKTIRVHKNLYRLKKTVNSKMAAVNFSDETAELLKTTCVELAHTVLWMYYSKDFFDEFQFVKPKDYDKMVLAERVVYQMNTEGQPFYLPEWKRFIDKNLYSYLSDEYSGDNVFSSRHICDEIYLDIYNSMRELKEGGPAREIVWKTESDTEKIAKLAYRYFRNILELYDDLWLAVTY